MANMVVVRLADNKNVAVRQENEGDDVRIFNINDEGEFIGVAKIPAKEFTEVLEALVPEDKRFWR